MRVQRRWFAGMSWQAAGMDAEQEMPAPGPWARPAEELAEAAPAVIDWAVRYLT
ncbi:hypothetical protein BH24ACT4_BH24ACT4_13280 [soil metagenome]